MSSTTRLLSADIITQDPELGLIRDGELAFDSSGRITYLGSQRSNPGPATDIDLSGHILMPGLVNGHTHSAMTLMRGYSDDKDLHSWLQDVQSLEAHMTWEAVAAGLRLALVEMIRTGTTAFADMYLWDRKLLQLVADSGMRVLAGLATFDWEIVGFSAATDLSGTQTMDLTDELISEFAGDEQIRIAYAPHAPYTCSPEFLTEVAARARKSGAHTHIHLSESAAEVAGNIERFGATPVEHVAKLGLFDSPVLVAHGVHLSDADLDIIKEHGAAVSHNPVSNLKLGSGVADLPGMLRRGIGLALGTDGAASNNSLDMFEELKTATILHRGTHQDPTVVAGADVLNIATRSGAAALGFHDSGVLAPGKLADVVAVRTDRAHATPLFSPESFITFAATGADVAHVFIGGRQVLRDGEFTTLDEAEIRADAARTAAQLLTHARS